MKTFLALLLTIASIVSYVVLATRFGIYQQYPIPHYLGALAGVAWLAILIRRRFTWPRVAALLFAALLTAGYLYWTLAFSQYESRDHRVRTGARIGEIAGFDLPGATGQPTRLFQGEERAVVLVFYRGHWCPYCRHELVELERHRAEFEQRKVRIVALSVDSPKNLEIMKRASGASFDFLSDPEGRLLDLFDVRHVGANPQDGTDAAQSATFLLTPDGRVAWSKIAPNYRVRPQPEEILAAVDDLPAK